MGPFSTTVGYTGCTSCSHTFCSDCPVDYPDKESERIDDAQDAFAGTARGVSGIKPEGDAITQSILGFAIPKSKLTLTSDTLPSLDSDHEDTCSAVQSLPAQHIIARPEQSAGDGEEKPVDGELFWECHQCSGSPGEGGPWLLSNTPACLSCNHQRCERCVVYEA